MTDFTFTLLRLGFLVLLWVFVLSVTGVVRRDIGESRMVPRIGRRRGATTEGPQHTGSESAAAPPRRAPSAPVRLVVTTGPLAGTVLPLGSSAVLIGRAPSCTLVLDDGYSSSRHARIFPHSGGWYVEDLGSTNGTFVNEQQITGIVPIGPDTPIRIGQSIVELQR